MDNTTKKEASIEAIKEAIASLNQQGKKVTQQNVTALTKASVSISTIRRHWKDVTEKISFEAPKKISPASKKISPQKVSDSFARFRKRAEHSTMGVYKCTPDMF